MVAGQATIAQENDKKLGITQHTGKAVINWQKFNIASGEHTQFYQPSKNAVILNRITGSDPSKVLGRMTANGRVMLINRNGVLFGPNSQIDVNGLVATTHDIRNEDFMAGNYNFDISGNHNASIVNEGDITIAEGGLSAFVAPSVQNNGVIAARLGKVAMGAGHGFALDMFGDGLISLHAEEKVLQKAVGADGLPLKALVDNAGRIEADGGVVFLTAAAARDVVDNVINQSGILRAQSLAEQNGEIILGGGEHGIVSVSGVIDATAPDGKGGRIEVTGEKVGLFAGATLDASGKNGGGTVLVGGDYLGGSASDATYAELGIERESKPVPTAQFVYMAQEATVQADALENGDGGKVVLWSDNTTRAHGTVTANGGIQSGNGGFVEVSGKQGLNIASLDAQAKASNGIGGTVLFDPLDVHIVSESQATTTPTSLSPFVASTSQVSKISARQVENILNSGSNVTIKGTKQGPNVDSAGDVYVYESIVKTYGGDARLSLFSADNVWIKQNVEILSKSGKLDIYVDADYDRHGYGGIHFEAGSLIATNGGFLVLNGNDIFQYGKIDLNKYYEIQSNPLTDISSSDEGSIYRFHVHRELVNFDKGLYQITRIFVV